MTFAKFSLSVFVLYGLYYGFLILIEKLKTKQSNLAYSSRKVHFVVEQPQTMLSADEQVSPVSAGSDIQIGVITETPVMEEKDKTILDDLGIEAYYSGSIDITEDNLLTLSHHEHL